MERPFRNSYSLILLLSVGFSVHATTVNSYWRNREGIKKFGEKSYLGAYQNFLHALEDDPLNPELHLNMALTFEMNEEYEKAEKAYKNVLKLLPANSPRRFEALFNLGGVLAKEKKIDEALSAYQAALDMVPDSKEVKTNIELLWQNGDGQGDNQNQNQDKKDQKGKGQDQNQQDGKDKKDKDKDYQDQQKEKKPKPFESQELTPQDVKKILDEIKNQEQAIRAQEYERNAKDAPKGKDW